MFDNNCTFRRIVHIIILIVAARCQDNAFCVKIFIRAMFIADFSFS